MAIQGGLRAGQFGVTLIVQNVITATEFYCDVFGAEVVRRHTDPEPAAELRLGDAYLCVVLENPNLHRAPRPDWPRSPTSAGAASATFTLYVDDVDAVLAHALAAGATLPSPRSRTEDTYWGDRVARFHDPAGHVWVVRTRREDVAFEDLPARFEARLAAERAS